MLTEALRELPGHAPVETYPVLTYPTQSCSISSKAAATSPSLSVASTKRLRSSSIGSLGMHRCYSTVALRGGKTRGCCPMSQGTPRCAIIPI